MVETIPKGLFFILAFLFLLECANGRTESHDLVTGGSCGVNSRVAGGTVVSHTPLSSVPPISNDYLCFFTMQAVKFRQKIRFMFLHFSLTPTDCSLTNLTFYDGRTDTDPVIATICPNDDILSVEYLSTSFFLTFKLQVRSLSGRRTANFTGFYVSYTDDRDPCVEPDVEMMCDNGRCIYQELQCDDLNSCGDNTDERTGPPSFCNETATTARTDSTGTTATSTTTTSTTTTSIITSITTTTASAISSVTTDPTNETMANMANVTDTKLFSNLTPLYIILSLAFALFSAYLVYSLLSFKCFRHLMKSCLHRCFLIAIRRRRKWKTVHENSNGRLRRKITPENNNNLILESLSSVNLPRNSTPNTLIENGENGISSQDTSSENMSYYSSSSITKVNLEFKGNCSRQN